MLLIEFLIVLIASIIASMAVGLLFIRLYFSPVFETRIFLFGTLLFAFYFFSLLPATILNAYGEPIEPISFVLFKLSVVFAHSGLFCWMLSIILPTISNRYRNLLLLVFLSVLTTAASIINFQTISFTISPSNYLVVTYENSFSLMLMIANAVAYVIVLIIRIKNVSKILNESALNINNRHILSVRFSTIHMLFVALAAATLIGTRSILINFLPGLTWFIPLSMIVLYLCYAIFKDESFLFITPAKFDALLISDKYSGINLLSKNFHQESNAEQLLGNLLSAVNISLRENLKSKGNLEEVNFGDKVVVTYSGEYVTSFLILTQANFVTSSIARFITKTYERKFEPFLLMSRENKPVKAGIFKEFDSEVEYVRQYIPL